MGQTKDRRTVSQPDSFIDLLGILCEQCHAVSVMHWSDASLFVYLSVPSDIYSK